MVDIIQELTGLRDDEAISFEGSIGDVCHRAAIEIERLRNKTGHATARILAAREALIDRAGHEIYSDEAWPASGDAARKLAARIATILCGWPSGD